MSFNYLQYGSYHENHSDERPLDLHDPSEISVEVDHLYPEDLVEGVDGLARRMLEAHDMLSRREQFLGRAVSRSTCMLIDDYYKLTDEHERPDILLPDFYYLQSKRQKWRRVFLLIISGGKVRALNM